MASRDLPLSLTHTHNCKISITSLRKYMAVIGIPARYVTSHIYSIHGIGAFNTLLLCTLHNKNCYICCSLKLMMYCLSVESAQIHTLVISGTSDSFPTSNVVASSSSYTQCSIEMQKCVIADDLYHTTRVRYRSSITNISLH